MSTPWTQPTQLPELDLGFLPAIACWNQWKALCQKDRDQQRLELTLQRGPESISEFSIPLLQSTHQQAEFNNRVSERIIKFLLWSRGGHTLTLNGPPEVVSGLRSHFADSPCGQFDADMMGNRIYLRPFAIEESGNPGKAREKSSPLGRNLDGCRIGFDLGASDRKIAAVIDGKAVFSEEMVWDPLPQTDPEWHFTKIMESLRLAAEHLPRVDAIGGSSAGVYVDNEVRVASLFRGISPEQFNTHIRPIFHRIRREWNDIPFEVVNDGEVTALAGSMALDRPGVLGIAMGSSLAVGYVNQEGNIRPWLNELAFCPIDWQDHAHRDEWSGDLGCGVQYFSQQAVGRLLKPAGIDLPESMKLPEKLVEVQKLMAAGDDRAASIYRSIGTYLGYAIPYYREFYDFNYLLVLGRVLTGEGGEIILTKAREILDSQFPDVSEAVKYHIPDETEKRHGQAIAAASLPGSAQ